MGNLGFSYTGLIFLLMLFIPNIIWTKKQPENYSSENENKFLVILEKVGEVSVTCMALIFSNFNINSFSLNTILLAVAFAIMVLYEIWWIRYFKSNRTLKDFYSSILGVPVAGATLPVIAFLILGIYGRVAIMIIATVILGIGHIGIHLQHKKDLEI